MYDTALTTEQFDGKLALKKGCKGIYTFEGKVIGGISQKCVCDLNGKELAKYSSTEKRKDAEGKSQKVRIYKSEKDETEFSLVDNRVYKGETYLGQIEVRKRNKGNITLLSVTAMLLILVIALVLLIDTPYSDVPRIIVNDNNGGWDANGTVAVLDGKVKPGSSGEYDFIVSNPHDVALNYSFSIRAYYNGQIMEDFPIKFRLKMNNAHIETTEWLTVNDLNYNDLVFMPMTDQQLTLEWNWFFEGDSDENDTLIGSAGGIVSLELTMTAEVN